MAWLSEKFAEIKLGIDDKAGGPLHLHEALEASALGIDGKRALWKELLAVGVAEMPDSAFERLIERAERQREQMETLRVVAARDAFSTSRLMGA
jgi:hypothetical protein